MAIALIQMKSIVDYENKYKTMQKLDKGDIIMLPCVKWGENGDQGREDKKILLSEKVRIDSVHLKLDPPAFLCEIKGYALTPSQACGFLTKKIVDVELMCGYALIPISSDSNNKNWTIEDCYQNLMLSYGKYDFISRIDTEDVVKK